MQKTLGLIGMLACSAGLFALPGAAGNRGGYTDDVSRGYTQSRPQKTQTYSRGYDYRSAGDHPFWDNTSDRRDEHRDGHLDRGRNQRSVRDSRATGWRGRSDWR